jgi:hypothetical protein
MEKNVSRARNSMRFSRRTEYSRNQTYYDLPVNLHFTEAERKPAASYWSFGFFAKIFTSITVLSGVLGVCYQKGMIATMQLGNMAGSYDVKEIFSSALSAYLSLFEILFKAPGERFFDEKLIFVFSLSYFAIMYFIYLIKNRTDIIAKANTVKSYLLKFRLERSFKNYALILVISALFSALFKALIILINVIVLAVFTVLLAPSIVGYQLGKRDALKAAAEDVCSKQIRDISPDEKLHQCTHLVVNGKILRGEILLQNSEGYYMRINNAYVYASRDGKTCVYSQDRKGPIKADEGFRFENEQLEKFCVLDTGV